jgi:hypothetical protein
VARASVRDVGRQAAGVASRSANAVLPHHADGIGRPPATPAHLDGRCGRCPNAHAAAPRTSASSSASL